jgi:hypothetical protein
MLLLMSWRFWLLIMLSVLLPGKIKATNRYSLYSNTSKLKKSILRDGSMVQNFIYKVILSSLYMIVVWGRLKKKIIEFSKL